MSLLLLIDWKNKYDKGWALAGYLKQNWGATAAHCSTDGGFVVSNAQYSNFNKALGMHNE